MHTSLTSPLQTQLLFSFRIQPCTKTTTIRSVTNAPSLFSPNPFPIRIPPSAALRLLRSSAAGHDANRPKPLKTLPGTVKLTDDNNKDVVSIAKPIALAVLYVAVAFVCPILGFRRPAFAAVATAADVAQDEEKGHEYSHCTRRLLECATCLGKRIEEARSSGGKEELLERAKEGLKEVKVTRKELESEIMSGLYEELSGLKSEKEKLTDRSDAIVKKAYNVKWEEESLADSLGDKGKNGKGGRMLNRLRDQMSNLEKEYSDVWDRIEEIEELIERKETVAMSFGVHELLSIERHCVNLFEGFLNEMKSNTQRLGIKYS